MTPILEIMLQAAARTAAPRASLLPLAIQFVAIIAIFWFLLIRPQRQMAQKHQEVLSGLKKGDDIITEGGIIGQVVHINEDKVTIKTAENTRLVVVRAKIAKVTSNQAQADNVTS